MTTKSTLKKLAPKQREIAFKRIINWAYKHYLEGYTPTWIRVVGDKLDIQDASLMEKMFTNLKKLGIKVPFPGMTPLKKSPRTTPATKAKVGTAKSARRPAKKLQKGRLL